MFKATEQIVKCPFCGQADIHYIYSPIFLKFKKGTYGGGKSGISRTSESIDVMTEKCPSCGKTASEIEKKLKGGQEINHAERIERMKKAGIPTAYEDKVTHRDEE